MKDKKHIDHVFKERFKNFEATPSPAVWENIQAKMKKDTEDRKVIPIWWKLAGVAALLALLFTIGNTVFFSDPIENEVVHTDATNEESGDDTIEKTSEFATDNSDNTTKEAQNTEEATDDLILDQNAVEKDALSKQKAAQSGIASETEQKKEVIQNVNEKSPMIKDAANNIVEKRDAVASANQKKQDQKNRILNEQLPKDRVIVTETQKDAVAKQNDKIKGEKLENNQDFIIKDKVIDATVKTDVAKVDPQEKKATEENAVDAQNTKSIFDAIAEQNTENTEEAVANTNSPGKRWDVAPNFAPVYYGSIDGGSSIDPSFADNSKNADVNFSYGVQVSYNINDRLSVRSGVSSVDLSYGTGGIEIGEGPVSSALRTVNYGGKAIVTTAADRGSFSNAQGGEYGAITTKSTSGDAQIIQNIQYYEVPLELKYAVVNKKIGVNLIGGFSTLFLGDNDVSVSARDFNSVLGEANNLSSVSFTTNVGLGFDYKLSSKFKFNIEPMFKYQLNPYTDTSVDFKPYYVGVYTGLSLSF